MLYQAYQAHSDAFAPFRLIARAGQEFFNHPWLAFRDHPALRHAAAVCELMARAGVSHRRPDFGITTTLAAGQPVAVREEAVEHTPFCTLLHFRKEKPLAQPKVLLVAPLSGHFATLLRGTVETLLPEHDVYITDWVNARNVPMLYGRFDLDDHIDLIISFIRELGPDVHLIAVCQPSVPVLAAVTLLAADEPASDPRTMTLMGGPIDTRRNPMVVNKLATSRPLSWFERNVIATVPPRYAGQFRRVYPGFLQLAGFMTMNLDRHVTAHMDLFKHLVRGDGESAESTRRFYNEYMSVMDLPADFYLQTVSRVFQQHALPLGRFVSRSRKVEPRAITRTA